MHRNAVNLYDFFLHLSLNAYRKELAYTVPEFL